MKHNLIKIFVSLFLFFSMVSWLSFATKYLYFYGDGCPHCENVKTYFDENTITEKFEIEKKEVRKNKTNALIFSEYIRALQLSPDTIGVPFMVIMQDDWTLSYESGDSPIINHFDNALKNESNTTLWVDTKQQKQWGENTNKSKLSLIVALLTTSLADSINPCVFAVMLLLLSTILLRSKSRKKAVISGLMFVFAIFLGYTFLGKILLEVLGSIWLENSQTGYRIQMIVGILWILIWLANLKDYFFPDVLPPMEVPLSRRPRMQKIVKGVLSPRGAFGIGIILTAFLLPCTAGPYVTFATYLSSYPDIMNSQWAYYAYLLAYNTIFIVPMLIIIALIGFGLKSVEELGSMRKKYRTVIHLIVGVLMLALGIYILLNIL